MRVASASWLFLLVASLQAASCAQNTVGDDGATLANRLLTENAVTAVLREAREAGVRVDDHPDAVHLFKVDPQKVAVEFWREELGSFDLGLADALGVQARITNNDVNRTLLVAPRIELDVDVVEGHARVWIDRMARRQATAKQPATRVVKLDPGECYVVRALLPGIFDIQFAEGREAELRVTAKVVISNDWALRTNFAKAADSLTADVIDSHEFNIRVVRTPLDERRSVLGKRSASRVARLWPDGDLIAQIDGFRVSDRGFVRDGTTVVFHPNGTKWIEAEYENGSLNGPASWYYEDGSLHTKGQHVRGQPVGIWRLFTSNGKSFDYTMSTPLTWK